MISEPNFRPGSLLTLSEFLAATFFRYQFPRIVLPTSLFAIINPTLIRTKRHIIGTFSGISTDNERPPYPRSRRLLES